VGRKGIGDKEKISVDAPKIGFLAYSKTAQLSKRAEGGGGNKIRGSHL